MLCVVAHLQAAAVAVLSAAALAIAPAAQAAQEALALAEVRELSAALLLMPGGTLIDLGILHCAG